VRLFQAQAPLADLTTLVDGATPLRVWVDPKVAPLTDPAAQVVMTPRLGYPAVIFTDTPDDPAAPAHLRITAAPAEASLAVAPHTVYVTGLAAPLSAQLLPLLVTDALAAWMTTQTAQTPATMDGAAYPTLAALTLDEIHQLLMKIYV